MGDRMVVVAAHLDDAVLSVGEAIATHPDVSIITVFAGDPPADVDLTDYDRSCGFATSAAAMVQRSVEHEVALRVLGATGVNLAELDHQYRSGEPDRAAIFRQLKGLIAGIGPAVLLVPMGLTHPDHVLLGSVCDELIEWPSLMGPIAEVGVYEDLPYRVLDPEAAIERLTDIEETLVALPELWPLSSTGGLATKLEAIACYQSQLSEDIGRCARVPERIWRYR